MDFDPQPLAILLQLARGLLRAAQPSAEDLRRLLKQTMAFLEPGDREQPEVDRYYSETAALLAEILGQTQDQRLRKLCMQLLLQLDCPGDILAAAELTRGKLSKDNAAQHLSGLEPHQRLRVLHRFFLLPRGGAPALNQWAFETVASVQNEDPEEALLYLNQLPEGTTAARPIQNELLRGRFGLCCGSCSNSNWTGSRSSTWPAQRADSDPAPWPWPWPGWRTRQARTGCPRSLRP